MSRDFLDTAKLVYPIQITVLPTFFLVPLNLNISFIARFFFSFCYISSFPFLFITLFFILHFFQKKKHVRCQRSSHFKCLHCHYWRWAYRLVNFTQFLMRNLNLIIFHAIYRLLLGYKDTRDKISLYASGVNGLRYLSLK